MIAYLSMEAGMMSKNHIKRKINIGGWIICLAILMLNSTANAQETGKISGIVLNGGTGEPLEKINVSVKGTHWGAATDSKGRYTISPVPPGGYTLIFAAIGFQNLQLSATVTAGETATVDASLQEEAIELGKVMVYAATKRAQRISEAPAAISTISPLEIRRGASTGQIPRLFEAVPGVDLAQSGVYDYNLNTRGFNSSLNRRVLVLLDNRETAETFLNAQFWNTFTFPLEDLARLELVRGPGSALYGANAYSGVINMTTSVPRDILGTKVSVSGGELNSVRLDVRHAGFSGPWSYKLNLGHTRSNTWDKSRNVSQEALDAEEYAGLSPERVPINDDLTASYGSGRLDYDFTNGASFTLEGGISQSEDLVLVTGLGRVQIDKVNRPWARATYASDQFFFQADYSGNKTLGDNVISLNSGVMFVEKSHNINLQFQHNISALDDRLRFIWGASQRFQHLDTDRTLTLEDSYDENQSGLFAQLEYQPVEKLRVVGAGRVDRSSLHDTQISPKIAVVFSLNPEHVFRATFNRAFQSPNFVEFFARALAGPPADLAPLEAGIEAAIEQAQGLPPGSVDLPLNFGVTPVLVLGNEHLEVEKVSGYEIGYKGVYSKKFFVTADLYFNRLNNFITDILPGVNSDYPAYQVPEGINPALQPTILGAIQQALGNNFPLFSTLPDGSQAFVLSYTNAGKVNEWGLELGVNYYITDEILLKGNWTYFDFDVKDQVVGDVLLSNTPQNKFNLGLSYDGAQGIDFGITLKYVEGYEWAAGVFQGKIPEYTLVNLAGGYKVNRSVRLGLTITNLLDNGHYEIFGGSLIGRRALGSVTVEF